MKKVFFLLTLLWLSHTGWAQTSYQPTVENRKAREQFQDEKFGIFLHWGLYSMRTSTAGNMPSWRRLSIPLASMPTHG